MNIIEYSYIYIIQKYKLEFRGVRWDIKNMDQRIMIL